MPKDGALKYNNGREDSRIPVSECKVVLRPKGRDCGQSWLHVFLCASIQIPHELSSMWSGFQLQQFDK